MSTGSHICSNFSCSAHLITVKSISGRSCIAHICDPCRMPSLLASVSLLSALNTGGVHTQLSFMHTQLSLLHTQLSLMLQLPRLELPCIIEYSSPVLWPTVDGYTGCPVSWAQASSFWCLLLVPGRSLHQCNQKDTSQKAEESSFGRQPRITTDWSQRKSNHQADEMVQQVLLLAANRDDPYWRRRQPRPMSSDFYTCVP